MASIEKRGRKSNKYIPNWMLIKSSKEEGKKIKTETISRKKKLALHYTSTQEEHPSNAFWRRNKEWFGGNSFP